jgi:hypothetical protein
MKPREMRTTMKGMGKAVVVMERRGTVEMVLRARKVKTREKRTGKAR